MKGCLNWAKANLAPGIRNSAPNFEVLVLASSTILDLPIMLASSSILPSQTLLILLLQVDINLLAKRPLLVLSIKVSDIAIRLKL